MWKLLKIRAPPKAISEGIPIVKFLSIGTFVHPDCNKSSCQYVPFYGTISVGQDPEEIIHTNVL